VSLPWQFITLTLVLDGLAGLAGGLLSERWLSRHLAALVGFAAGALLAAVFLEVLPETLTMSGMGALTWAFAGFVLLALVEWLLGHLHRRAQGKALPAALLLSDALHNVGDGVAIAAAFLLSTRVGVGIALAVIAHEVPQEIGDYALLRQAGWRRARALIALTGVQLTAVLGALGVVIASGLTRRMTGPVLSLAAGTFLYIGATDLLPELKTGRSFGERCERMIGFLAGIGTILLASALELG
jgi:zinc and cadmium transporter